jgi:hypothetical protein
MSHRQSSKQFSRIFFLLLWKTFSFSFILFCDVENNKYKVKSIFIRFQFSFFFCTIKTRFQLREVHEKTLFLCIISFGLNRSLLQSSAEFGSFYLLEDKSLNGGGDYVYELMMECLA